MLEMDDDSEEVAGSNHWLLPSSSLVNLWDNLIYEGGLKERILNFAHSALTLSQHNVNHNIISCNRLILLHGPPGTGKTSLCKAIAQKLSIRLQSSFKYTHLIEINCHSLFSKWFSESGKMVMKLFANIREIIAQPNSLVCVLIDEVESIAYARNEMCAQEPKDAMRVVNALLTQLDSIKEHSNVLVLATSNIAKTIDAAFLDRADIKQFIGLPSEPAAYQIHSSMIKELMRVGILRYEDISSFDQLSGVGRLAAIAIQSKGLSGRTIRKLPFLALASFIAKRGSSFRYPILIDDFIDDMLEAIQTYKDENEIMS